MVNQNTSATGGILWPAASPAPLEGQDLLRFIQQYVVAITGLPGNLVRPRWQPEPANIPEAGEAWAAVGVTTRASDTYPYIKHTDAGDEMHRHEELNILSSFYDLGSNGMADYYAAVFRDGLQIDQNNDYLRAANMGLISSGDLVAVPSLLKERWLYRVDLVVRIRREIIRIYPVESVLALDAILEANDAGTRVIVETITTTPP